MGIDYRYKIYFESEKQSHLVINSLTRCGEHYLLKPFDEEVILSASDDCFHVYNPFILTPYRQRAISLEGLNSLNYTFIEFSKDDEAFCVPTEADWLNCDLYGNKRKNGKISAQNNDNDYLLTKTRLLEREIKNISNDNYSLARKVSQLQRIVDDLEIISNDYKVFKKENIKRLEIIAELLLKTGVNKNG